MSDITIYSKEIHLHSCLFFSVVIFVFRGCTFGGPKPGTLGYMIYPNASISCIPQKIGLCSSPNLFCTTFSYIIYQSLARLAYSKSAMLHGSMSHFFFSIRNNTGRLPDSYRTHPGWGVTPTNRETEGPPRKSQESKGGRSRKVRWFHRSAAWGRGMFKTWELKELKKKLGGSTWNSCIMNFALRCLFIILMMTWYMGENNMDNDAKEKVLNLWNMTTIMFRGLEVFFALFIFSVWALIFCDNVLCFFDPQKTSRTLWIAFTTGHSFFSSSLIMLLSFFQYFSE